MRSVFGLPIVCYRIGLDKAEADRNLVLNRIVLMCIEWHSIFRSILDQGCYGAATVESERQEMILK